MEPLNETEATKVIWDHDATTGDAVRAVTAHSRSVHGGGPRRMSARVPLSAALRILDHGLRGKENRACTNHLGYAAALIAIAGVCAVSDVAEAIRCAR